MLKTAYPRRFRSIEATTLASTILTDLFNGGRQPANFTDAQVDACLFLCHYHFFASTGHISERGYLTNLLGTARNGNDVFAVFPDGLPDDLTQEMNMGIVTIDSLSTLADGSPITTAMLQGEPAHSGRGESPQPDQAQYEDLGCLPVPPLSIVPEILQGDGQYSDEVNTALAEMREHVSFSTSR
ncbi:hypothetical protein LTR27_001074 [Elasticomyces elasticus]|nr:hypothetical protein LTR27_001074 [Elasticomyces elasticus]